MQNRYTHLLFDIDGTLVDTEKTGVESLRKTVKTLMNNEMTYDEGYRFFGIPSHLVPGILGYSQAEEFIKNWQSNFMELSYYMTLFPGVSDLLHELKKQGFKMGVVTSRSRFELDFDKNFTQVKDCFDIEITADVTTKHKPNPDPAWAYMKMAGEMEGRTISADECLFLGDTIYDYRCGHDAGCDFALADWRNRGLQDIPAEHRFTSAGELRELLMPIPPRDA